MSFTYLIKWARFEGNAESGYIANPNYQESKLGNGDFNSGLYCVKYPFYRLMEDIL